LAKIPAVVSCHVQLLMQHGAQLDEPGGEFQALGCLMHGIMTEDLRLLWALLSCLDKMTPAAKKWLEVQLQESYSSAQKAGTWQVLLAAKGLEMLPYMGTIVIKVPEAAWPEVRHMQGTTGAAWCWCSWNRLPTWMAPTTCLPAAACAATQPAGVVTAAVANTAMTAPPRLAFSVLQLSALQMGRLGHVPAARL
jgi:hypothetical protein